MAAAVPTGQGRLYAMLRTALIVTALICIMSSRAWGDDTPPGRAPLIRSAASGRWSDAATWEGKRVPGPGTRVQVRAGHTVTYDASTTEAIRSIHVAGILRFDPARDTRLDVGLIKIQAGDDASENGFDCDAHAPSPDPAAPRAALEVGTFESPIPAGHTAVIRLAVIDGMDPETCPAIVCCGGRMDLHGAPLGSSWVKLGRTARAGDAQVTLEDEVAGWKPGDRVVITATQRIRRERGTLRAGQGNDSFKAFTEERKIQTLVGHTLELDRQLNEDHRGEGDYRGEVANLSRNVVIESADPARGRGHTMYHRGSAGSIGYVEFRHLGKEGLLGKYNLHFHLAGDTMRGTSIVGASFWDSGNRWLTIHGTNDLVVRDCVGYQSIGHGFFLEDGTEVDNVFDRNLAVQAFVGKALPKQNLPFDNNGGAGFWWANCRNTFTRNVAVECDRYGFKFEAETVDTPTPGLNVLVKDDTPETFDLRLPVRMPDGTRSNVDIRTLPFVRFEDNEAHSQLYGINLGESVRGVGPDDRHPFVLKNTRLWNNFWAFRPGAPSVLVDGMDIYNGRYGLYRPAFDRHAYSGLAIAQVENPQAFSTGETPKGFKVPGPLPPPKAKAEVAKGAVVRPVNLAAFTMNPLATTPDLPVVKASSDEFPAPLEPIDDLPPATVITSVANGQKGEIIVRGTTSDNGTVRRVRVNDHEARALRPNFAEWELVITEASSDHGGAIELIASAEDAAGNVERRPHRLALGRR
jgi:hypothetical protein